MNDTINVPESLLATLHKYTKDLMDYWRWKEHGVGICALEFIELSEAVKETEALITNKKDAQ